MRRACLAGLLGILALAFGACVPGATDNLSQYAGALVLTIEKPLQSRTVPEGTVIEIAWVAFNDTEAPASITVVAEGRPSLTTHTLATNLPVTGGRTPGSYQWDTAGFDAEKYIIRVQLVGEGGVEVERRASGEITIDGIPQFEFVLPTADAVLEEDGRIAIAWNASDPEGVATAQIGLDPDLVHDNGDEIFIEEVTLPDEDDRESIDWAGRDIDGQIVEPGTYNLFALVDDEVNELFFVDGLARITVEKPEEPEEETEPGIIEPAEAVEFLTAGDPLTIEFGVNNETEDTLVDLKLDTDDAHTNGNEIAILLQRLVGADTETDTFDWDGSNSDGNPVGPGIYSLLQLLSTGAATPTTEVGPLIYVRDGGTPKLSRETWTRGGQSWSLEDPNERPVARSGAAFAFDSHFSHSILYGGEYSGGLLNDTWLWEDGQWENTGAGGPTARRDHVIVDDSERDLLVLFGGHDGGNPLGDTWEWNGTLWTEVVPATSPSARSGHAMAYDAARRQVVLFGGDDGALNDETWTFDGNTWTQQSPATSPDARRGAAMVYDDEREEIVLFGGETAGGASDDTWIWDGSDWTLADPNDPPPARYGHGMAFDTLRNQAVLIGGTNGTRAFSETWTWNGSEWTNREFAYSLAARADFALAFDGGANECVLFGGDTGIPLAEALQPATDRSVTAGSFLSINWRDDDPTGVATIRVTYAEDALGTNEVEVLNGRAARDDGVSDTFNWQLPRIDPGTYTILVYIDTDGAAPWDHVSVAPGLITVPDPNQP